MEKRKGVFQKDFRIYFLFLKPLARINTHNNLYYPPEVINIPSTSHTIQIFSQPQLIKSSSLGELTPSTFNPQTPTPQIYNGQYSYETAGGSPKS